MKREMRSLVASVFALLTVCKSGASFNRIETCESGTNLAEKTLMKPHNIQVLTLLHMFGCGSKTGSNLKSPLMQMRNGEGKSMILGADVGVLGFVGFRVRVVGYCVYL